MFESVKLAKLGDLKEASPINLIDEDEAAQYIASTALESVVVELVIRFLKKTAAHTRAIKVLRRHKALQSPNLLAELYIVTAPPSPISIDDPYNLPACSASQETQATG